MKKIPNIVPKSSKINSFGKPEFSDEILCSSVSQYCNLVRLLREFRFAEDNSDNPALLRCGKLFHMYYVSLNTHIIVGVIIRVSTIKLSPKEDQEMLVDLNRLEE